MRTPPTFSTQVLLFFSNTSQPHVMRNLWVAKYSTRKREIERAMGIFRNVLIFTYVRPLIEPMRSIILGCLRTG